MENKKNEELSKENNLTSKVISFFLGWFFGIFGVFFVMIWVAMEDDVIKTQKCILFNCLGMLLWGMCYCEFVGINY